MLQWILIGASMPSLGTLEHIYVALHNVITSLVLSVGAMVAVGNVVLLKVGPPVNFR